MSDACNDVEQAVEVAKGYVYRDYSERMTFVRDKRFGLRV